MLTLKKKIMTYSAIRQRWTESRRVYGLDGELVTAGGQKIAGRYVLTESGSATPSHDPLHGFRKSEGFPVDAHGNTVNDRDYERDTDAQMLTRDIASCYDSRALQSPVIVSREGIVLSGNGRTMSGMIAADSRSDGAYLAHLTKYACQYGLSADDVESFSHARLLFEVSEDYPYTTETFAMFNAQEMKSKADIMKEVDMMLHDGSEADIRDAVKEAERIRRTEAKMEKENIELRMTEQTFAGDACQIVKLLKSFKIEVDEMATHTGANVTLYEFRPRMGVRISKIRNLKDEIAIALGTSNVRIIAPMPNGTVGIEVPNRERQIIPIADMLNSEEYRNSTMAMPLALGRTNDNQPFVADLADMPHLLVAGATGQGKSVGLNTMLLSLLNAHTPDDLRLVLIDPKQVELNIYQALEKSYLAAPVITDAEDAARVLQSLCTLMDERYDKLNRQSKRNIAEYNSIEGVSRMPYIVTVIDEYGDLVMVNRNIEYFICRLAQKARAVGIHLIISTQRPSVDIVTGNIKANFPTRIAFRTTTGTDSRVILDRTGAEMLTGKGDMLLFSGADTTRLQCAYTSIDDVVSTCSELSARYADCRNAYMFGQGKDYEKDEEKVALQQPLADGIREVAHFMLRGYHQLRTDIERFNLITAFMDWKLRARIEPHALLLFDQLKELGIVKLYRDYYLIKPGWTADKIDALFDSLGAD